MTAPKTPRNGTAQKVELIARDRAGSYGIWGQVFILFGRDAPDGPGAELFDKSARRFMSQLSGAGAFLLILRQTSTPTPEARDRVKEVFSTLADGGVSSICLVMEATGFAAAIQRSIATAFLPRALRGCKVHVASSIEKGVNWLGPCVYDSSAKSRELLQVVHAFVRVEEAPASPSRASAQAASSVLAR